MKTLFALLLAAGLLALSPPASSLRIVPAARPGAASHALPMSIEGRAVRGAGSPAAPLYRRQWPGTYVETAFKGAGVLFEVGSGDAHLAITVDGGPPLSLLRPRPGFYRIEGLDAGAHRVRVEVISESLAGPTELGGFYALPGTRPSPAPARTRQIEFVGDSHTVGYANTSTKRACTDAEVWAATDTSQGLAARVAGHYGADYQVNAISGRGVVRNYNGFSADPLPQAYPFVLFDRAKAYAPPAAWRPRIIVVSLGTNDFSTPLNPGEKWPDRQALRADFEATYAAFIARIRARNPQAFLLVWSDGQPGGEVEAEVGKVIERLRAAGERRLAYVPVTGLQLPACNYHPDLADDGVIATALTAYIDAHPEVWDGR